MSNIPQKTLTLYLTPSYKVTGNLARVGRVARSAGEFDLSEFNLKGRTVVKTRSLYTEDLDACTGMVVLAQKLNNLCHENSSKYTTQENTRDDVFAEITKKIVGMVQNAKDNIQVGLFGGWGYGNGKNASEIEKSHHLFNNVALCIEDELPEKEGLKIPLLTVWGKLGSTAPDAVYARENIIVLVNEVFKNLFKDGKCDYTQEELINFLKKHYEEVLIPDNVLIVPEEKHQALNVLDNIERKKKRINYSV